MLSVTSKDIVRATLPAVGAAIGDITALFYQKLFAAHPDLQKNLFNRGNQQQGAQQKALAGSIAAFATLQLDPDPERVRLILSRIAHKHASLGVTADQYWVVHQHLFEAIVEVLGEAVTPEVASAWDEVYWLMANTLISLEKELYREAGVEPGQVWRTVRVTERAHQSPDTVTFTLAAPDAAPLPTFSPGQYLSIGVHLPDGARQIRQYSLCGSPSADTWRITVKRVAASPAAPAGEVSNHLYNNLFEGDTLEATLPFGDLTVPDDGSPLLLVSAGIGCTPMIGMLTHLAETADTRPISVLHADRSLTQHAHRAELTALADRIPNATVHRWYESLGDKEPFGTVRVGLADLAQVPIADGTKALLCGPLPFMLSMREALLTRGVAADDIHYEVFGPDSWGV